MKLHVCFGVSQKDAIVAAGEDQGQKAIRFKALPKDTYIPFQRYETFQYTLRINHDAG